MFSGVSDLRYALRQLRHAPGATALILLALGLAIGANATVFSVANGLLLRPLGVTEPERLVRVGTTTTGDRYGITSWPDYLDLREAVDGLDGLAAHGWTLLGFRDGDVTERLVGEMVTWDYWGVIGVEPRLGRPFLREEDRRGAAAPIAVLSYELWRDRLRGDPGVVGSTIRLSDVPYTVVGVAPPGFRGLSTVVRTDVWVPAMMVDRAYTWDVNLDGRMDPWLNLVGRLGPDATLSQVQASLDVVGTRLQATYPATNEGKTFSAVELERTRVVPSQTTDGIARGISMLMVVGGLVLLIACFNVASVFVARSAARGRELAMRFAMGASRPRIFRQLLTEGLLVAVLAAAIGLLLGSWGASALWALQPDLEIALDADLGVDVRVLAFAAGLAALTALVFAVAPALYAVRRDGRTALRNRVRGPSGNVLPQRVLVAAQVALAVVVLLTAGLFLRSMRAAMRLDPGFDLRQGLVAMVNLSFGQYDDDDAQALFDALKPRVEALPGVRSAALATSVPLGPGGGRHDVRISGYEPSPGEWMVFRRNMIDGDYLATMGIRVLEGRGIDPRDRDDTEPVAVVNQTMARRFWPDGDAVGGTLYADGGVARTVVGVIADGMYSSLGEAPEPSFAIPLSQAGTQPRLILIIRTAGNPETVVAPLRREVAALAPALPLSVATMREHLLQAQGSVRGSALMTLAAGILALVVALAGVYGVTAYTVSQRTHEFGVRIAMGASGSILTKHVLAEGLRTTLFGVGAGLLLALAVARLVQGMLFQVRALDPAVFASVGIGVAAVALLAVYLPARRAADMEPMAVLRSE